MRWISFHPIVLRSIMFDAYNGILKLLLSYRPLSRVGKTKKN